MSNRFPTCDRFHGKSTLLELLHVLGVVLAMIKQEFEGVRRQDEVPSDADRRPIGYVDDDVYESTRAFTGWDVREGKAVGSGGEMTWTLSTTTADCRLNFSIPSRKPVPKPLPKPLHQRPL